MVLYSKRLCQRIYIKNRGHLLFLSAQIFHPGVCVAENVSQYYQMISSFTRLLVYMLQTISFCSEKKAHRSLSRLTWQSFIFATRREYVSYISIDGSYRVITDGACKIVRQLFVSTPLEFINMEAVFSRSLMRFLLTAVCGCSLNLTMYYDIFPICAFFPTYLHVGSDKFASYKVLAGGAAADINPFISRPG